MERLLDPRSPSSRASRSVLECACAKAVAVCMLCPLFVRRPIAAS